MTFLGKLMVMLNVVLSIAILAVALASFTNPVDFSDNAPKDGNPPGLFKQRSEAIAKAWEKIPDALKINDESRASVDNIERYNKSYAWFKQELEHLETGASKDDPAKTVKYNGALPERDPKDYDRVVLEPPTEAGQPIVLLSRQGYEAEAARLEKELRDLEAQLLMYIRTDISETMKRLRHKDANGVEELGLHQRLTDEEFKYRQALEEIERVKPLLVNALVESQLIVERRLALESRLEELKQLSKSTALTPPNR